MKIRIVTPSPKYLVNRLNSIPLHGFCQLVRDSLSPGRVLDGEELKNESESYSKAWVVNIEPTSKNKIGVVRFSPSGPDSYFEFDADTSVVAIELINPQDIEFQFSPKSI